MLQIVLQFDKYLLYNKLDMMRSYTLCTIAL